jgi:1-deoxy-D-xylulose-5-phosphate reductoisomerase
VVVEGRIASQRTPLRHTPFAIAVRPIAIYNGGPFLFHALSPIGMTDRATNVAVLGSTGSIGRSTLEVIAASGGRLRAVGLSAHSNTDLLLRQAQAARPRTIVVTDPAAAARQDWSALPAGTELHTGPEAVAQLAADPEVDIVVSAIVGSAGLRGTWAALEAGKTVALANKESLVVGGPLMMELARRNNAKILPVDSEHSALFQALQAGRPEEVRRVILTASGGPFRTFTAQQLDQVTVAEALNHPTWAMGPKITVDSATLMNKALEIIEARWLFGLSADQIAVVIHPQSIVHSMVEYRDGSVIAQLSPPDMKLPIQYALTWPERREGVAAKLDWSRTMELQFEPPDLERFGALRLGLEAAAAGGTAGAVLNGANEAAVAAFLDRRIGFNEIVPACRSVLQNHKFQPDPSLEQVLEADRWARQEVLRCCT